MAPGLPAPPPATTAPPRERTWSASVSSMVRLAGSRRGVQHHEATTSRERVSDERLQLGDDVFTPDNSCPSRLFVGRHVAAPPCLRGTSPDGARPWQVECLVLTNDAQLEISHFGGGLEAHFLRQSSAQFCGDRERIRLAARSIQGEHQDAPAMLPERICAHQASRPLDNIRSGAECKPDLEKHLLCEQLQLAQSSRLLPREGERGQIRQSLAGPAGQGLSPASMRRVACPRLRHSSPALGHGRPSPHTCWHRRAHERC